MHKVHVRRTFVKVTDGAHEDRENRIIDRRFKKNDEHASHQECEIQG